MMAARLPEITISRASTKDSGPKSIPFHPGTHLYVSTQGTETPAQSKDGAEYRKLRRGDHFEDIDELLREHAFPHEDFKTESFWSDQHLRRLLTPKRIAEELVAYGVIPETSTKLAETIAASSRKVFAILCMVGKGSSIQDFMNEGITDGCLPLVFGPPNKPTKRTLVRSELPDVQLRCVRKWCFQERKSFESIQHRLCPAYLDLKIDSSTQKRSIRHERYEATIVLPLIEREHKEQGGYGVVSRVRVHPDCHGFSKILYPIRTDDGFALKEIVKHTRVEQSQTDREFWQEVENLERFSGFSHPHLVTLLMTWTIKDCRYLLFPLADCDLDRYLEQQEVHRSADGAELMDLSKLQWLSKQILGMASALHSIHNPRSELLAPEDRKYGRHGDLKPENILWYESTSDEHGILVIADLGLSTLNSILSRSNVPNGTVPGTPRYRPPEYDIEGGRISRSYDIWTFGCLLLEIVCWILGGPSARKKFSTKRMSSYITGCSSDIFFDVKRKKTGEFVMMVKAQVSKEFENLHNHRECTSFLHDLLFLVEEEMLVVLSAETVRITANDLVARLTSMHSSVVHDGYSYCQKACRPYRRVKIFDPVDAELKAAALVDVQSERLEVHRGRSQRAAPQGALADPVCP